MKYYRTYITTLNHPTRGIQKYAGKHVSRYSNPNDDPYVGSGRVLKSTLKKYGNIVSGVEWFDHNSESDSFSHERELISYIREQYGVRCLNLSDGGEGNSGYRFTPEQRAKISLKTQAALNSPEVKQKLIASANSPERIRAGIEARNKYFMTGAHSETMKRVYENQDVRNKLKSAVKLKMSTPEMKAKISALTKNAFTRPEVKAAHSAAMQSEAYKTKNKLNQRKSPIWKHPLKRELYDIWSQSGEPSCKSFAKTVNSIKQGEYTGNGLRCLVKEFKSNGYVEPLE